MRYTNWDVIETLAIDVILIPLKGIGNMACVSLALNVTAITWAVMTLVMLMLY